ncbi:DUF4192 domain-containing protein [Streptomyces sp. NBC_01283]|uniref:DUF4192 domain-containing protein n=1 Tax=Streptomyces sp. NBC_01283 TaxID=2903812 RepID=UPI00352EB94D|nr:DUF4192 domain-containing protein [Streptomyces sp. NBC_01283]
MANHSEQNDTNSTNDSTDSIGPADSIRPADSAGSIDPADSTGSANPINPIEPTGSIDETTVTLRTPAELADALPYLLGFRPEESVVLIALHGERGRFGGRVRLGIPGREEDWPPVAQQLAQCLVGGCERRGARPDGIVAFLCVEPVGAESGRQVMERLRPLAQVLRTACGSLDVPVFEVVCISAGTFWTYCCPNKQCCPPEGVPLLRPGTSVLAAATAYAGLQVGVTPREMRARLAPWESVAAADQEAALDAAGMAIVHRILEEDGHAEVAADTLDLARRIMARIVAAPSVADRLEADLQDDELLAHDEAAALILGLQDRTTRDRAAEWMEGDSASSALRLWRALARRCVGAYGEHAAAPLALAGWVAWSLGDTAEGQEALDMALCADPSYTFAQLLHHACTGDLDPEPIRRCLRRERTDRDAKGVQTELPLSAEPSNATDEPVGAAPRRRRPARPKGGTGSRAADRPSTGPQNRRRTIRRAARNDT